MKHRLPTLLTGILIGAVFFGGGSALAAGILATPFEELNQRLTLNGQEIHLTGYNINGNNYFMLRDIGEAVGFNVTWEGEARTVAIDTTTGYVPDTPAVPAAGAASTNTDGSINLPSDGSRYVPKTGDVIRCDDGTNYTITDVSRYDKNMFAFGPVGDLPTATCDWSLLPQPELPAAEARHFTIDGKEYLFARNLYETRRMLYTLYNAIGANPETWQNGAPVPHPSGNPKVKINLTIDDGLDYQSFWPWRESEIVNLFNSCPPGTYSMECWDVYSNGVFQRTEYQIRVTI